MTRKHILAIACIVTFITGCAEYGGGTKEPSNVEIQCNKVLVIDTLYNPTFCFVLEFKNKGIADKSFLNNYILEDSFSKSGFVLEDTVLSNLKVQVGSTLHSKSFLVKAGQSRKLLFIYKNVITDSTARKEFEHMKTVYQKQVSGNWFDKFVENAQLTYRYFGEISDPNNVLDQSDKSQVITEDMPVVKGRTEILYFKELITEDANRFTQ